MTHFTEKVGFPDIELIPGMQLVLEAIDPTVDATVAGATASRWSIYGDGKSGDGGAGGVLPDPVPPFTVIEEP